MNVATGIALGMALSQPMHGEPPLWFTIGLVLCVAGLLGLACFMIWESFK